MLATLYLYLCNSYITKLFNAYIIDFGDIYFFVSNFIEKLFKPSKPVGFKFSFSIISDFFYSYVSTAVALNNCSHDDSSLICLAVR